MNLILEYSKLCVDFSGLIPVFPFIAFLIIVLFTIKQRGLSSALSVVGIFISFLISLGVLFSRIIPGISEEVVQKSVTWLSIGNFNLEIGILIDNLSAMMLIVVSFIAFLIQVYSLGYMSSEEDASFSRYYAYMSLFACSMLSLVLANNFLQIYAFWELVGLCSYLLIGFYYKKKSAADAAKKAFIVTRFGDLGFLIGIIMISYYTHNFNFVDIFGMLPATIASIGLGTINLIAILIFCGAIGKSAQFPLHIWLPDAMEGPTPVSALIHAATMVAAGVFLVARVYPIFEAAPQALLFIAIIGAITAFIAASIAVVQSDIKRVMAYSTISQLGYMMLALGCGGMVAGSFHLMTHAFFKALLFLCAGSVIHACHTNNMWEMGGLGKKMPKTGWCYLIATLAIAGVPPFSGFWSKDEILTCVSTSTCFTPGVKLFLSVIAFSVVIITAFYMFRSYYLTFCGNYRGQGKPHESPANMTVPLMILAFFAATLGFIGTPYKNYFSEFIKPGLEQGGAHHEINYLLMGLGLLFALTGIVISYVLYKKDDIKEDILAKKFPVIWHILEMKYWMDEIWLTLCRYTMFAGAKICAFIDEKIIDGSVNGIGKLTLYSGEQLKYEQTGNMQYYALMMVLGLVLIIAAITFIEPSFLFDIKNAFFYNIINR